MNDSHLFETLTRTVPGIVWITDEYGRSEFNNAQWSEFTGLKPEESLGHGWLAAIHPADAAAFRANLPMSPMDETIQAEIRVRRQDGVYHRHLLNVRHVGEGKWVGCAIDAHEWLNAELRDNTQTRVLEMVSAGAELNEVLRQLCLAAEEQIPGATCTILPLDLKNERFLSGVGPRLPQHLLDAVDRIKIGPRVGSCGTAAYERRNVISSDIGVDPLWEDWRDLFMAAGYRACWSMPVFATNGDVTACFGFYFTERRAPTQDEHQELVRLRGLASLAIERARILEALRESEEHYRHTVEQNPQIPWTADPQGKILSVSSRWVEATGINQAEALQDGWLQALHPDDVERTLETWGAALSSGEPFDMSYRLRMRNGQYRWSRARASARRSEDGEILRWYGTVEDVHEHYLAGERLRLQAYQDELTNLPNRRHFIEELRRSLSATDQPIGLMVLDIDDFKMVNDRFGHLTGDAVLRLFGRQLQRAAAPGEFVARLAGDEFAIICNSISDEQALLGRAKVLEGVLDAGMKANVKSRSCRPSIGCTIGRAGEEPDEVFKRADLALYAAKTSGKGTVRLFDSTIRSAAAQRSGELELARTALKEGWIEAHYQPVVSLETRKPRGFEALLRIRHPERGLLSPHAVLASLDDPRLSDAIGIRMAQLVVEDMARWRRHDVQHGQVSLNLATENLVGTGFYDTLAFLIDQHDIPPEAIKLEITERVLVDEQEVRIRKTLTQLRQRGISISLDDFGTGYASLVHLQTMPVDEIKIDRSFVSGLGTAANRGEIVRAMIGLARSMGMVTVAEGVEDIREALVLATWGCEFGQGYLFGKPMPFDAVALYLADFAAERLQTAN